MIRLLDEVQEATTGEANSTTFQRGKIWTNITGTDASVTVVIEEQGDGDVWHEIDSEVYTTIGSKPPILLERSVRPIRAKTLDHGSGAVVTVSMM